MHTQSDDPDVRIVGGYATGGLDAVEFRHSHIHHDDIGAKRGGEFDGFAAVTGFADDFQIGMRGQDHAETLPHNRMIVS